MKASYPSSKNQPLKNTEQYEHNSNTPATTNNIPTVDINYYFFEGWLVQRGEWLLVVLGSLDFFFKENKKFYSLFVWTIPNRVLFHFIIP